MGKRITRKMAKRNRKRKIQKKYRRRAKQLREAELNVFREQQADGGLNFQEEGLGDSVDGDVQLEMGGEAKGKEENQENVVVVAEASEVARAMGFLEVARQNGHVDGESNIPDEVCNAGDDDDNVWKKMGTDAQKPGENQEIIPVEESSPVITAEVHLVKESSPIITTEEFHPVNDDDSLKTPEYASRGHTEDEPKETGDHHNHHAEKIMGNGDRHQRDHHSDPVDDVKPDANLSIDKHYKENSFDMLVVTPELLRVFDAGFPIGIKKNPPQQLMKKKASVWRQAYDHVLDFMEAFDRLMGPTMPLPLQESQKPWARSHYGAEVRSSAAAACKGRSSSLDPPDKKRPPQKKSEMPGIECWLCEIVKPYERMVRTYCNCRHYALCLDDCMIYLLLLESAEGANVYCLNCGENLFYMEHYVQVSIHLVQMAYMELIDEGLIE